MSHRATDFLGVPLPYTYNARLDLRSGNYTPPSDVVLNEIRCDAEGSVTIQDPNGDFVWHSDNHDILRARILSVRKFGTNPPLREDSVSVHGYREADLVNHTR